MTEEYWGYGTIVKNGSSYHGCHAWETAYVDIDITDHAKFPERRIIRWQSDRAEGWTKDNPYVIVRALIRKKDNRERVWRMKSIESI